MGNSANEQVISRLKRYLTEKEWLAKARSKNADFANAIESLTADKISFGKQPTLIRGYVSGNSTASGEKTYGDTTTKRTTSIDFTTDEMLFVSDHNAADMATCRAAATYVLDNFSASDVHGKSEARSIAERRGKELCRQALYDLDFSMQECRLNRYNIHTTTDAFTVPIWPIYATIKDSKGNDKSIGIRYYYTYKNENYIHLSIDVPMTGKQKLIVFGVVAGLAVVAIALLAMLF